MELKVKNIENLSLIVNILIKNEYWDYFLVFAETKYRNEKHKSLFGNY